MFFKKWKIGKVPKIQQNAAWRGFKWDTMTARNTNPTRLAPSDPAAETLRRFSSIERRLHQWWNLSSNRPETMLGQEQAVAVMLLVHQWRKALRRHLHAILPKPNNNKSCKAAKAGGIRRNVLSRRFNVACTRIWNRFCSSFTARRVRLIMTPSAWASALVPSKKIVLRAVTYC